MRDDELRARLEESNPWWTAGVTFADPTLWAHDDRVLRERARFDIGYRSRVLIDLETGPLTDALVVLRGPRRVGKSVAIKDLVVALCRRPDVDPRQVIYVAADGMRARDLRRAISLGRDQTRSVDQGGRRARVWLLDEVTSVEDWTATLKYLRDNTPFGDDTVLCTGSSWNESADIERDLLAGRAGVTATRRTRLLLPMRLRDVLEATRPEIPLPDAVGPSELQSDAAHRIAVDYLVFAGQLDLAWQSFLISGGFPRAVSEHSRQGAVSDTFLTDLEAWLHRDVDRDAPVDSVTRLLAELHLRSAAPLNRVATANHLGYPSRGVFDLRLNRLVRSFGAIWSPQVNLESERVAGALAKLYLVDPVFAWIGPRLQSGLQTPTMPALTESTLAVAMAAAIEDRQPGRWLSGDTVGYLRAPSGAEVDLAPVSIPSHGAAARTTPIEAKWVSRGWRAESRAIRGRLGRGVVATKDVTDVAEKVWAIPAPLVALLIA